MEKDKKLNWLSRFIGVILVSILLTLTACVDQHSGKVQAAAQEQGQNQKQEPRLIATSPATVEICNVLDLPLVGIPKTVSVLPERYRDLPIVGGPMGPDIEIMAQLKPTQILGPDTLADVLEPTYQAADLPYRFLNLRSVAGLYDSIEWLGEQYQRQTQAEAAIADYEAKLDQLNQIRGDKEGPTVLLLMGFPGSYCEATASSYIGNLVEMAGGVNVVTDASDDFVSWNTEQLMQLNPDYILWTSHAMPKKVEQMFQEEFSKNDVWKHFTAVKQGRVVALDSCLFHMSANFRWPEALAFLYQEFYGEKE